MCKILVLKSGSMKMRKSIFITGGTSGIGLALAHLFVKEGHRVAVSGRNQSKLTAQEKSLFNCYEFDVSEREAVRKAVNDFSREGLDMMIANAGISVDKKLKKPDFQLAKKIMETNYFGTLNAFEAALDFFYEKKNGHLVAVASVAGLVGLPGVSSYSASKAAVIKLCESFSLDLAPHNIDVTCVCPGFIDTPLTQKNKHPMPFLISGEEAAHRIYQAIHKKMAFYVFPKRMNLVMMVLEKMPRFLYRFVMQLKWINYSREAK